MILQERMSVKCLVGNPRRLRWIARFACVAFLFAASGCFEKTYSDRMEKTKSFYTHKDKLNRNLGPEWSGTGYRLRVPVGFELLPPPEPKPVDPANPIPAEKPEEVVDTRQPSFLGIKLPGLVSAWKKDVSVDEHDGAVVKQAYIYLLSNVSLYGVAPDTPGRIEPLKFHGHVSNALSTDIMTAIDWDKSQVVEYPSPPFNLVPRVAYRQIELNPMRLFEETQFTFKIHQNGEDPTQTILLLIYPSMISSGEKLNERMGYCLETLKAPASPQQANSPAGGATGGTPVF